MYLKSLTLKGFKSFASATTLKFEPGICAVVGPNGSGKSNVVDALAWVMGEHSAKTLRGGKMDDVIFAGAGDRKPLGRAEVTLTIDNSDGALPIEYREVSVTRRMYRDGASEYEINGAKARLMDIQELLSDSGIGREMHIIVGQGKLAEILESRPEDRRAYIEEAAGVLKHRRRREKAHRKLGGMQANLDRLTDITDELGKQLKPLARQAEAAQRAATVQADLRDARLRLAGAEIVSIRRKGDEASRRAAQLREQRDEVTAQLEEATENQLEVETQLAEVSPQADAAQHMWFNLSNLAERISATERIAVERASNVGGAVAYSGPDPEDLEARAGAADEEEERARESVEAAAEIVEEARELVSHRQEAFQSADREHLAQVRAIADRREGVVRLVAAEDSLNSQIEAARAEISRQENALTDSKQRASTARNEVEAARIKLTDMQSAREELEVLHVRAASESAAAESRLEQLRDHQRALERNVAVLESRIETYEQSMPEPAAIEGSFERIAQLVSTTQDTALAAVLGEFSEALSTSSQPEDLARQLENAARTTIVTSSDDKGTGTSWRLDVTLPDGAQWLLDQVTIDASITRPLTRLLADVVLVKDVEQAVSVVNTDPRLRAVTTGGVVCGEGWLQAGSGSPSTVEMSSRISEATEELAHARKELEELSGTFAGAKAAAEESRVNAASAKAALREHDTITATHQRDVERLEQELIRTQSEHEKLAEHTTAAEARLSKLNQELNEIRDRLSRVDDDHNDSEPNAQARDEAATELEQAKERAMQAQMAFSAAQDKLGHVAGRGDSLRRQAEHERQAKARHERAMARRKAQAELAAAVDRHARMLRKRVDEVLERVTQDRDRLNAEKASLSTALSQAKQAVSAVRHQAERLSASVHEAEIAHSEAQVRIQDAEEKIVEQLGIAIPDLLTDYSPDEDFDLTAQRKRLKQAERDLNALGKVNPLALEEYKALEERYSYLSTQLNDVITARKDLIGVIEDVDAKILQLFKDAWLEVEAEFPKVFSTLFPGGEGRLILTDPEDMLTTGIEVEARPPGKRVKRLSLLSGGEKSLTALALLVAIFRARPSPFYVMDEVEAALDDVNLRRLIALFEELRKDSQLIVITHQKPTMDVANVLYGVTMRGDGVTRVLSQRMNPAGSAPGTESASADAQRMGVDSQQ